MEEIIHNMAEDSGMSTRKLDEALNSEIAVIDNRQDTFILVQH